MGRRKGRERRGWASPSPNILASNHPVLEVAKRDCVQQADRPTVVAAECRRDAERLVSAGRPRRQRARRRHHVLRVADGRVVLAQRVAVAAQVRTEAPSRRVPPARRTLQTRQHTRAHTVLRIDGIFGRVVGLMSRKVKVAHA